MAILATYEKSFDQYPAEKKARLLTDTEVQPEATAFGLEFPFASLTQTAERLAKRAAQKKKTRVAFVNAHCINEMCRSKVYDTAVRSADMILPDGSGMALATKLASGRACNNLNGTDLAPALFEAAQKKRVVGILPRRKTRRRA